MTVQEIHRYVWNAIIHALEVEGKCNKEMLKSDIINVKSAVLQEMYDLGMINDDAYAILSGNNACVLCSIYMQCCSHCPLGDCADNESLYAHVFKNHDIEAAKKIRDIDVRSGIKVPGNVQRMIKVLES